jgi:hypothetical protein
MSSGWFAEIRRRNVHRARRGTIWARCLKLGANTRATASLPYYLRYA